MSSIVSAVWRLNRNSLRRVCSGGCIVLSVILLGACQPQENRVLPTLQVLPTLVPSSTPTDTETPLPATATETTVPSATPTSTSTPVPSTPTETVVPPTPTPLPTQTGTRRPSPTPTASITATTTKTETATSTATGLPPAITLFTSDTQQIVPNSQVTLSWSSTGERVRIERLNAAGQLIAVYPDLPDSAAITTVVEDFGENTATFRLVAQNGSQESQQLLTIAIVR